MYRLFLWVIALSCGPGLQVTIYAKYWKTPWDSMMSKWESVHGPFVREYYYEGKVDKYFPQRTYSSDEDPELPTPPAPSKDSCEAVKELRFDCFPRGVVTEQSCVARGCCYQQSTGPIPSCFYPKGFASYNYTQLNVSDQGVQAELTAMFQSSYPRQKTKMYLSASFNSNNELLIIFSTTSEYLRKSSWYQPQRRDTPSSKVDRSYDFKISKGTLGFQIVRKSNGRILFDTQKYGGWLFSDQFAQISTPLPSKYIYGLEERANEFPLNTNWNTIALLNHDTVPGKVNGYGSYGAYFCLEGDGKAHSVEFGNSAPAEFRLQPGGLTARFLEPDFYITITLGDSPEEVFKNQISHSQVPPFWALGFHFSRFGFKSTENFKAVVGRMKDARIPLDTMWTDIDYMDRRNDFTLSSHFQDLPKYVDELHENGMHYVLIIDPGVSGSEKPGTYPPYDLGIKKDIFIKDSYGKKPLVGRVWNPKTTVFPDFTHSGSLEYWIELIEDFHKKLKFDGIWLDMNEPSNFVNGSVVGCPSNRWENPPYVPEIEGGVLNYHTICMSAKHQAGLHYYLHNEHAALECIATCFALTQLRNERSFVISRGGTRMTSDFSGIWTGDVRSTWDDMKQSVRDIMTFNVLGQSLIGADICGFNGNTTQNLCRRWHQLGAFYPFSRNHNTDDGIDQDPIALKIEDGVRPALIKRYSLLPYLYTLFFAKSKSNLPVVRPTWYMFPDQEDAFTVDYQFFWGDAVLIVPALEDGLSYVKAYIGSGVWYDEESLMKLQVAGTEVVLPAPANHIPILIRGGNVIPTFNVNGSVTTKQLRDAGSIKLIVALDDKSEASGIFYWDDGVTFNPKYTFGHFAVTKGSLQSHMYVLDYKDHLRIDTVQVFATDPVTSVTVNSVATPFNYNQTNKVLTVEPKISLYQNFTMTWQ